MVCVGKVFTHLWEMDEINHSITLTFSSTDSMTEKVKNPLENREYWGNRVHPSDLDKCMDQLMRLKRGEEINFSYRLLFDDGRVKWYSVMGSPMVDDEGNQTGKYIGSSVDITRVKTKELQRKPHSDIDYLTQLPGRNEFIKTFEERLSTCEEEKKEMTIMKLDINRFKVINDTYGHLIGDQLLIKVSKRLSELFDNEALISRDSGDEFTILIEEISEEEAMEIAEMIYSSFRYPLYLDDQAYKLSVRIGISRYPETAENIEILLQQAESAMMMVKNQESSHYHLFNKKDNDYMERQRRLEIGLTEAISKKQLSLVYQPKVDLDTKAIYGVEALLRWKHSELGMVSPAEFIPIAEKSGMIYEIGYWVLFEAIRQIKEWQDEGLYLQFSVNVSPLQYEEPFFVERVENTLRYHDVDPKYLTIEITETVMQNTNSASCVIERFQNMGIHISIDDFGTGYSSLSTLNNIRVDFLKIDKSFIDPVPMCEQSGDLVKTIIQMGHNLGFKLVAEGIETQEQANYLKQYGCHFGQGYLYAKPLPPDEIPSRVS